MSHEVAFLFTDRPYIQTGRKLWLRVAVSIKKLRCDEGNHIPQSASHQAIFSYPENVGSRMVRLFLKVNYD